MNSYYLNTAISLYWNLGTGNLYFAKSAEDFWLLDLQHGTHLICDDADQCHFGNYSVSLYSALNYLEKDLSEITQLATLLHKTEKSFNA